MSLKIPSGQIGSALEWYYWIGLEKDINSYIYFYFFISLLICFEYLKRLLSYEPLHIKMNLTSCLFGSRFILNPFFLFLAHFYLIKNPPKFCTILVWIAGCWNSSLSLQIFYSRAVIQRTIVVSPVFLVHSLAEMIAVCAHTNHDLYKQEVGFIFV
jgi:hypothetical protein